MTENSGNSSVGRASAFQAEGREFEPRFPLHFDNACSSECARVAQSVEHFHGKEGVISSILIVGSILIRLSRLKMVV